MADNTPTPGDNSSQPAAAAPGAPASPAPASPQAAAPAAAPAPEPAAKPAEPAAPAVAKPADAPAAPATPEAKPADQPPATPDAATVDPNAIPEKYELVADAEAKRAVAAPLVEAMTPIFKEAKVTAAQAQKMVDTFQAYQKTLIPLKIENDMAALRADPVLGGLNIGRTQQRVNDALAMFTTVEQRARWEARGLVNDPDLVHFVHAVGLAMQSAPQTEGGFQGGPPQQSREKKLYGGRDLVAPKPN